jgi:hypothetical protein
MERALAGYLDQAEEGLVPGTLAHLTVIRLASKQNILSSSSRWTGATGVFHNAGNEFIVESGLYSKPDRLYCSGGELTRYLTLQWSAVWLKLACRKEHSRVQ